MGTEGTAGPRHASAEERFGRNVRTYRAQRGWTQAELAARLGLLGVHLHPSAIAKIEMRDAERPRAIRLDEASALARVLGVSLDRLIGPSSNDWREVAGQAATLLHGMSQQKGKLDDLATKLREVVQVGDQDAPILSEVVHLDELDAVVASIPWEPMERYVASVVQENWFRSTYGPEAFRP